jgi:hypothetical protein
MLCAGNNLSAQGIGRRAITKPSVAYKADLGELLKNNDTDGIAEYRRTVTRYSDYTATLYKLLNFIATHKKTECLAAEELLSFVIPNIININDRYGSLLPPLPYLIRKNHDFLGKFDKDYISDTVFKLLIEKGANVNSYDKDGNSLMTFALETENQYLSQYFIEQGISLTKPNTSRQNVLSQAIDRQDVEIVKQIIATTDGQKMLDVSHLNQSIALGNLELVKLIREKGIEITQKTLTVKTSDFKNNTELYNYLTALFADQSSSFDDVKRFVKTFDDRFDLVKDKMYSEIDKMQQVPLEKVKILMDLARCFSMKNISDYYVSKETFGLLLDEISKVSILSNNYTQLKDAVFDEYMTKKYENGINAWKALAVDFPERKTQIVEYAKRFRPHYDSYSYTKWPTDIKSRLNSLSSTKSACNAYINSGIPDEEGLQLAKKYYAEADNAQNKYLSDLPKAESYEAILISQIRQIKGLFENLANLPMPEYTVKEEWHKCFCLLGCDDLCMQIAIKSQGLFLFSIGVKVSDSGKNYEANSGRGYGGYGYHYSSFSYAVIASIIVANGLSKDYSLRSDEYGRCYLSDWEANLDFAESIVKQYKEYGIKEWWKIKWDGED